MVTYTAPELVQFTVNGTYVDRPIANVLHYRIDVSGSSMSRPDACEAMCGIVINEWCDSILPRLVTFYTFTSVSWVDLDSPTGTVGNRTTTAQETLPQAGGNAGQPMPGNVALLVRKNLNAQRGARKGRIYVPAQTEATTASGVANLISSTDLALWQTAFTSFLGDTNQLGGPTTYNATMCVNHVLTRVTNENSEDFGKPLTGIGLPVTSLSVEQRLATQRRRLRG